MQNPVMKNLKPEQYTVAWLCALLIEFSAARAVLDEVHGDVAIDPDDDNAYVFGEINGHNVVIACMPIGQPGKVSASLMASSLRASFKNIRITFFVGIGGGVPKRPRPSDPAQDIFLGDVVVGCPENSRAPAVVQYDLSRDLGNGRSEQIGALEKPHRKLRNVLTKVMGNLRTGTRNLQSFLAMMALKDLEFARPNSLDILFEANFLHNETESSCESHDSSGRVNRGTRTEDHGPVIHLGTILSGDSLMRDSKKRDSLSSKHHNALCFEMEAAGVVDQTKCLVIRGIADYCDSHKNKVWQGYSAATAAAFTREVLLTIRPREPEVLKVFEERKYSRPSLCEQKLSRFTHMFYLFAEICFSWCLPLA